MRGERGGGRGTLIKAGVEIAGRLAVHITLYAEGRGHAAAYWQGQRFRPVAHLRNGIAKRSDRLRFSGRRFQLCEALLDDDVLLWKMCLKDPDGRARDGLALFV